MDNLKVARINRPEPREVATLKAQENQLSFKRRAALAALERDRIKFGVVK